MIGTDGLQKYFSNEIDHQQKDLPESHLNSKRLPMYGKAIQIKSFQELYSLMLNKYKLIAPETTLEQFKAVFTGQPIESINPIKWHQDNASELLYFIDRLQKTNNIVHNPKSRLPENDCLLCQAQWKSI